MVVGRFSNAMDHRLSSSPFFQNRSTLNFTVEETKSQAFAGLDQLAKSMYGLVESHQEVNEKNIKIPTSL